MRSIWGASLVGIFLSGGSAATLGCSDCSVSGQEPIAYDGGTVNPTRTVFESGAPNDEMLYFPQGRVYRFEHGLSAIPYDVQVFLSFRDQLIPEDEATDEDNTNKTKPNNVGENAGNQAVIEVWDDKVIQIRNDTCAEFYMRVVAVADPTLVPAGGAGGQAP